ncbi:MAG: alpha/beta hydrolase-fold protein [Chloroflexota bacterium]
MDILIGLTAVFSLIFLFIWSSRQRYRRLLAGVPERVQTIRSEHLGQERTIYVYLPPGYEADEAARYPTLYVNDGQDREALKLRETLARLYARRQIRPFLVVAIPTNEARLHEYGTAVSPNAQELGTLAGAYGRFVGEELLPHIESHFRVQATPQSRAFLGASLGGLSAFDIVWNHPHLFLNVGVFSGSFWWRAPAEAQAVPPKRRIAHAVVRQSQYRPGFRGWFEAATRDETADRDNNGVIDAIQDTLELLDELEKLGYQRGRSLIYHEVQGGRHDYVTWSRVLPLFLRWLNGR